MAEEPAAKKQKTEEAAVPAGPEEKEKDAKALKGDKIKETVTFHTNDTTMNVMVSSGGSPLLMPLSDGGIRHLLAGARASVGLKGGRYMFEAKIVEMILRAEDGAKPSPKQVLRLGFSTSQSSLLMGHGSTDICFDMEGFLLHDKKRTSLGLPARYNKGNVLAVVLNLDKTSPNASTISLFKDGVRVCEPQALPESLQGKALYPTINYRNVAVSLNFGPSNQVALPFTCNMVQEAMASHSVVTPAEASTDFEVVYPCCLPDQGGFDWLDFYKAKHPTYTELSDRMILDWAEKSGIPANKIFTNNDKPEFRFGVGEMDDFSIRRMIQCMAPLQKRNYIIMELKGNLTKDSRSASLAQFFDASFKKKAVVVMGTPDADFKKKTQELMLKDKQEQSDAQFKKEKEEAARKKAIEKRQKDAEKAKKKAEKERQKKLEEMKKAQEKAKKEAERKKAEAEGKELPPEDEEEETKEDVEMEEEVEEEEAEEVEADEEPPKVTLTAEEKKQTFRKLPLPDIPEQLLNTSFTKFSLPELDEGFDDIDYEWSAKGANAGQVLQKWVMDRKLTSRVEDLAPSMWFKTKYAAWQKLFSGWQSKQVEYRNKLQRKASEKAQKEAKKQQAAKIAEAKAAAEKAKKEQEKAEAKEDEAKEEEEVKAEEEEKVDPMQVDEEEEEEEAVDFEGVDIFGVDEVDDIGGGMPLYKDFGPEDWTLMALCFELHLMSHAFKKDCDDPDRKGIILEHLGFYYNRYYQKGLSCKSYGVETDGELISLAKDCVFINKDKVLESLLDEEIEYPQVFVKIAEESRRHRALLLDMGDESAKLKFLHMATGKVDGKGAAKGAKGSFGKGPLAVGPLAAGPMNPMASMANAMAAMKGGKGGGFGMPFGKGKSWKGK